MARLVLLLLSAMLVSVTATGLRIYQGRVSSTFAVFPVERVATVELGATTPPGYYFDCNTTANSGTGISWRRMNGRHRFPTGNPVVGNGVRLDASNIDYPDLDVYICEDNITRESITLNITSQNPAILVDDNNLGDVKGQTVKFKIYASSYPLLSSDHIQWYRPDGSEILDDDDQANFQESGKVMLLNNVQPEDVGMYECVIRIPITRTYLIASTMFDLDVYVTPSIIQHPQNLSNVFEWTDVTISCAAEGNPPPTITWEREGGRGLPLNTRTITRIENATTMMSSLIFMDVRQASSGRYRCVASTIYTASNSSYYADIIVTPAILLNIRIGNQPSSPDNPLIIIEDGNQLSVDCFGSGTLQWTASNGLPISLDQSDQLNQRLDVTRDVLILTIQSFNSNYETTYTCSSTTFGVESSVFVTNSNPAVFISNKLQYVLPGNSSTLSATVIAYPQQDAVSQWYLNGQLINVDSDDRYSTSKDGNQHMLHVRNAEASLLGEYAIVVTLGGQNSSDFVNLSFPDPPTALVTPSDLLVTEGDHVQFQCQQGGDGTLTVTWSMEDEGVLPEGVSLNGTDLVIPSVSSEHRGTYVCTVSSFAGSQSSSAVLTVFYRPTTVIKFGDLMSTSNQVLSTPLIDGLQNPTFSCTADGNPPPTFEWVLMNGGSLSLPNGVMQGAGDDGHELRWQRPLEYTDSGEYQCRASNSNGTSVATLNLLVEATPVINSIYPTVPVTSSGSLEFLVPNGYVGVALTCNAFGWPPPLVEWTMNAGPLPTGVISANSASSAIINSGLRWTRGFQTTDVGVYQCVVRKSNTTTVAESQIVTIRQSTDLNTPPPVTQCNINDDSNTIYFQIRVFETECTSWDSSLRQHIANEFRDEILSIVESECSCGTIESNYIQILDPECSQVEEGAVVFRGLIVTSSASLSKDIFCSLSRWQMSGSYVTINNQRLHSVDSQCSLQLATLSSTECVNVEPQPMNQNLVIYIAVGAIGLLLVGSLFVFVICCVSCCCCLKRKSGGSHQQQSKQGVVGEEMYSRTRDPAVLTRYGGRHSVGPTSDNPNTDAAPLYSTLENIPPRTTPPLPPPPPFQPSPDHDINYPLLNPSSLDAPDGDTFGSPAESYQLRLSADSVKFYKQPYYPDSSDPSSSTSRLTSPTQKMPHLTSQSSSSGSTTILGATNPIGDYEQIDGFSRVPNPDGSANVRILPHGSVTVDRPAMPHGRKLSESGSSAVGGGPPMLSTSAMFSVREEEEKLKRSVSTSNSRPEVSRMNLSGSGGVGGGFNRSRSATNTNPHSGGGHFNSNHSQSVSKVPLQQQRSHPLVESQMSGPPPPYSSRPPSALTASASSMVGNEAYESRDITDSTEDGNNSNPRPWYESDFSLESNSRKDLNGTQESIPPYAMIHNSAIPVTRHQGEHLVTSLPNNIQAMPPHSQQVGGSGMKRPVLFTLGHERKGSRGSPQPYSEPIQSSMETLASYGRAQESPNFEMVTV